MFSYLFKSQFLNPHRFRPAFPQTIRNHDQVSCAYTRLLRLNINFHSFIFTLSPPLHVFLPHYFVVVKHLIFPCRNYLKSQVIEDFSSANRANFGFPNSLPFPSSRDL